jgi:branched-chain amino acid transport system ATP-binding protein
MLRINDIRVGYGVVEALHGVSLRVDEGSICALIGANGAGKTTLLRTVSGLLRPTSGTVELEGEDITRRRPDTIVSKGICHVPEGRHVFPDLTVSENLDMGAYLRRDRGGIEESRSMAYDLFPRLAERARQYAGTLSGGEQQMLAMARALMGQPRLLLLDEPSLGLAPNLVHTIFGTIAQVNKETGVTILLVEQNANMALLTADHGCVLETGRIVLSDDAENLRTDEDVKRAYLGG